MLHKLLKQFRLKAKVFTGQMKNKTGKRSELHFPEISLGQLND